MINSSELLLCYIMGAQWIVVSMFSFCVWSLHVFPVLCGLPEGTLVTLVAPCLGPRVLWFRFSPNPV